jgi:hypothetical protein
MINTGLITKNTFVVDEMNRPLSRVHLAWGNGGGTTTDDNGQATVIAPPNQRVKITYVGMEPDYYNVQNLPKKIILMTKTESLGEVVINANPKKVSTPNYIFPALGAASLLLILMSLGSSTPKQVTL